MDYSSNTNNKNLAWGFTCKSPVEKLLVCCAINWFRSATASPSKNMSTSILCAARCTRYFSDSFNGDFSSVLWWHSALELSIEQFKTSQNKKSTHPVTTKYNQSAFRVFFPVMDEGKFHLHTNLLHTRKTTSQVNARNSFASRFQTILF